MHRDSSWRSGSSGGGTIEAVAFDYGGVLGFEIDPSVTREMARAAGASHECFVRAFYECRPRYDAGELTSAEYWADVVGGARETTTGVETAASGAVTSVASAVDERFSADSAAEQQSGSRDIHGESSSFAGHRPGLVPGGDGQDGGLAQVLTHLDIVGWSRIDPIMVRWMHALRKNGLRLIVLSNMPREMEEPLLSGRGWSELLEARVVSGAIGASKPSAEIYRVAAARLKLAPEKILFLDDRAENVDGARQAGFHAVHYRDPRALRGVLEVEYARLPVDALPRDTSRDD